MKYMYICLVFKHKRRFIMTVDKVKIKTNHFEMPDKFKALHEETKYFFFTRNKKQVLIFQNFIELLND